MAAGADPLKAGLQAGASQAAFSRIANGLATSHKSVHAAPREALLAMRKAVDSYKKGRWGDAALAAAEAADIDQHYASAFHLLALALDNLGERHQAFTMYERALTLDPHDADLYLNIGTAAWGLGMYDGADRAFRTYIEMRPDCSKGYNNLAGCLRDKGKIDEAVDLVRNAIMRLPQAAELWNTLGTIMVEICDFTNAQTFYREALRLDPGMARAWHNLGHALNHTGPLEEALDCYGHALSLCEIDSDRAETLHARGLCLVSAGRPAEGWPEYEERHNPRFSQSNFFAVDAPRWDGQDLAGRKLLLMGEQGLGDEIMFASLVPDLTAMVGPAGKIMIACDHRLVPLLQRSFPQAHVGLQAHTRHNAKNVRLAPWARGDLKPDFYTPLGTPLQHIRRCVEDFPARAFLMPEPARVGFWRERLSALGPGPYVGICWRSMLLTTQRRKFFSPMEAWRSPLSIDGIKFVNLQYGDCSEDLAYARDRMDATIASFDDLDLKNNLDDNAALCAALDLVVSAPTAAAALAAGTGTETWFLTAGRVWPQLGTQTYPWYAKTRVLTPGTFGDWPALMSTLSEELRTFAALHRSHAKVTA
jgi:tetratricopeptide (TPR) repeat protein